MNIHFLICEVYYGSETQHKRWFHRYNTLPEPRETSELKARHISEMFNFWIVWDSAVLPPHFLSMHRLKMQHWLGVGFTELEEYVFYQPGGYPCFVSRNIRRCRREDTYKIYHHSSSPL